MCIIVNGWSPAPPVFRCGFQETLRSLPPGRLLDAVLREIACPRPGRKNPTGARACIPPVPASGAPPGADQRVLLATARDIQTPSHKGRRARKERPRSDRRIQIIGGEGTYVVDQFPAWL